MTLQFKIQIRNIQKPPVWRRIVIPANFTFNDLHLAIQDAFGWENYHLYQFEKAPYDRGWKVKVPDEMDNGDFFMSEIIDSEQTIVSTFLQSMNLKKFVYVYDFGDDWIHDITLEKTNEEETILHPICLAGKGACPPEDCGGPWGYENMKQLFAEAPDEEETLSYKEWMGLDDDEDYDPNYFDINEVNVHLGKSSASDVSIPIKKNKTQKQDTPLSINPNTDINECLRDLLQKLKNMSESERKAFIGDLLLGDSGDDEDDDDDYELEDIHGIYDLSEKAKRYTVRVELVDAPEKVTRTLQLPSNMVLCGFAQLIMLAFGRQDVPEPYEFVEEDGFRYVSDDEEFALDKDYWKMDDVEFNIVGFLLQKKGETVNFNIRKGKKKVVWRHTITLEKSGRYTEKSERRIELLKGEGFYPSKSMKSMDDYVKHFQEDKQKKPNFDSIRQRIHDFEADNELPF